MKRFWEKVNKDGPVLVPKLGKCWVWIGYKTNGYGRFSFNGENRLAYVVAWLLFGNRKLTYPKEQLDHLCRNRACVRPSHLEVVSNQINSQRSSRSTLNPSLVRKIKSMYRTGRFTYRGLASHLKLGKGAVDFVLRGLTWGNIQ